MEFLRTSKCVFVLCLAISACASQRHDLIREHFDEATAATITEVIEPWTFMRERPEAAVNAADYISLTAVDVNRVGDHRLYLVAQAWSTIDREVWRGFDSPDLQIFADGRALSLKLVQPDPNLIGFGSLTRDKPGRPRWIYTVNAEQCAFLAHASQVRLSLKSGNATVILDPTNAGGAALSELVEGRTGE
jgi:hypothetical protein